MAAVPLVDTYQRYKAGTAKLKRWMSDSVRRKALTVKDLVRSALEIVAATDPTIEIPIDILDILQDVIKARRAACDWYSELTRKQKLSQSDHVAISNEKHQHFVATLEEVFKILRAEVKSRRPKRKKKIELSTDAGDLNNLFLHLELEDPASDMEDAAPRHTSSTKPPKPTTASRKKQPDSSDNFELDAEAEALFAIYCYLTDMLEVRLQTRKMWEQYAAGDISFMAACQIFDQAVTVTFMLSQRFETEYPQFKGFGNISKHLGDFDYTLQARGEDMAVFGHRKDRHLHNLQDPNRHKSPEFLMMPAWCALVDAKELVKYASADGTYDENLLPTSIFPSHPFGKALLRIAADLAPLADDLVVVGANSGCRHQPTTANCDLYSRALAHSFKCGCLNTCLVAATMLYLDLHDILDGDLERGMREVQPLMASMRKTGEIWREYWEGIASRRPDKDWTFGETTYEDVVGKHFAPRTGDDGRDGWLVQKYNTMTTSFTHQPDCKCGIKATVFVPNNILCALPVFPAQAINMIRHEAAYAAFSACNDLGVILEMAHLYNACKLAGACSRPWEDMYFIIARENENAAFLRQGDGTLDGAAKQFCLAMGFKLSQVAGKSRVKMPRGRVKTRLQMSNISHFDPAEQDKKLAQRGVASKTLSHQHVQDLSRLYAAIKNYASKVGIKDEAIASQFRDTRKLTPGQLLQVVQEIFVEDDLFISFDLLQFFMRASWLFRRVMQIYGSHPSRKAITSDSEVVNEILWDAAAAQTRGKGLKETALWEIGEYFDTVFPSMSADGITEARQTASGHISEHLKPAALYGPSSKSWVSMDCAPAVHVHEVDLHPHEVCVRTSMQMSEIQAFIAKHKTMATADERAQAAAQGYCVPSNGRYNDLFGGARLDAGDACPCCWARTGIKLFTEDELQARKENYLDCLQQVYAAMAEARSEEQEPVGENQEAASLDPGGLVERGATGEEDDVDYDLLQSKFACPEYAGLE